MFSVVIPLFNKICYIESTISSVLSQSLRADELIVVDDGSTDGSADLVEGLFSNELILVRQVNSGVSAARNTGMSLATNEFICLLDADDQWHPSYLQMMKNLILSFPKCVFYGCGFSFSDENFLKYTPVFAFPHPFVGPIDFLCYFSKNSRIICSSSVCIRKSLLIPSMAFPLGMKSGEDIHLWLRLGMLGSYGFNSSVLARIERNEYTTEYLRRLDVLPGYLELISDTLLNINNLHHKLFLHRILRRNVLIYGLIFVQYNKKFMLRKLFRLVVKNDYFSYLLLHLFVLIPSSSVIFFKKLFFHLKRLFSFSLSW